MLDTAIQFAVSDPILATLSRFRGTDVLVLGLVPSGVRLAARIVAALDGVFDVVNTQRLNGADGSDIGSVTGDGTVAFDAGASATDDTIVAGARAARDREHHLRGPRPRRRISNRIVIVVDEMVDGLGAALRAVIRSLRPERPGLVLAVAGHASAEAYMAISSEADLCLWIPELPGDHLTDSSQTGRPASDQEIKILLDQYGPTRTSFGHHHAACGGTEVVAKAPTSRLEKSCP